jgi:DNA-cytosine methyltransferase
VRPARRRLDSALTNATPIKIGHDFCGIQAPLQALEEAGVPYYHIFSSDNNPHVKTLVMKTFRPNVFYDDVTTRDNKTAPYVDMLVFGPPCQPWSAAGLQKGLKDPKNRGVLLFASLGYIKARRPACFVMEEVATVLTRHKKQFKSLKHMLEACDYIVCEKILDTKLHGVPRSRRRLYMVGIRKDRMRIASFRFPADLPGDALPLHKVLPRRVPNALMRSELHGHAQRNFAAAARQAKKNGLNVDKERRRRHRRIVACACSNQSCATHQPLLQHIFHAGVRNQRATGPNRGGHPRWQELPELDSWLLSMPDGCPRQKQGVLRL